jgi:hypothetical protein
MELSKPTKYLQEWFVRYIKNRDILFRKLSNVSEEENRVLIEQKDGKKTVYVIEPFPTDFAAAVSGVGEKYKGLVVYNSKENFDKLIEGWGKLLEVGDVTIYFINPFSKTEKKWIINPTIHAKIADDEALKPGILSMYETVEPVVEKEIDAIIS